MFLLEIAEWCEANRWPLLNALVINEAEGQPAHDRRKQHAARISIRSRPSSRCGHFAGHPLRLCALSVTLAAS